MYHVEWAELAVNQLMTIWTEGDSNIRRLVTPAVDNIDRQLADHPLECGESRTAPDRVLFVPPLGIIFRADDSRRRVRVLRVWLIRRHSG